MAFPQAKATGKGGAKGSGRAPKVPAAGPKTASTAQGGIVHYHQGRKIEHVKVQGPPPPPQTVAATPAQQGTTPKDQAAVPPTPAAKATGPAAPPPDNTPPPPATPADVHAAMDQTAITADAHRANQPPKKGVAGKFPKGAVPPQAGKPPPKPPSQGGAKPNPFQKKKPPFK